MTRKAILSICLFILALPGVSWGDMQDYASDYLGMLEKEQVFAFSAECAQPEGKAALIFPGKTGKILLIEWRANNVVNLADVSLKGGSISIGETHGGVYSYNRVLNLTKMLASSSFKLVLPQEIRKIPSSKSSQRCPQE